MTPDESSAAFEALIETIEDMNRGHLEQIRQAVKEGAADGVRAGMAATLSDSDALDRFSHGLFDRLAKRGGEQASQWVGKRLLTAALVAMLGFTVAWLAKLGVFK